MEENSRIYSIALRKQWADIAKGFAIILMIIGHMPNYFPHIVRSIIYSFHMPFFFILAGYFYNAQIADVRKYVKRKLKRLILPYLAFNVVYIVSGCIFRVSESTLGENISTILIWGGAGTTWFFLVLFEVELLFLLITNFGKNYEQLLVLIMFSVGVCCSVFGLELPFKLNVACTALGLYAVGHYFVKRVSIHKVEKIKTVSLLAILWAVCFCGMYLYSGYTWELNVNMCSNIILGLGSAISATLVVLIGATRIETMEIPGKNVLAGIGYWSLYIFPLSGWLPNFIMAFFEKFGWDFSTILKLLVYIFSYFIIYVITRIVKR